MTTVIPIKGVIINNDDAYIYAYLEMDYTSPKQVQAVLNQAKDDIELEINSVGGDVDSASEIYTMLSTYQGNVIAKIVGLAASSASVIAMAGNTVEIGKLGQLMIHRASAGIAGNADDFSSGLQMLNETDQAIAKLYAEKTGKSVDEMLNLMKAETWLGADRAIELGLADSIIGEDEKPKIQMTASLNLTPRISNDAKAKLKLAIENKLNKKNEESCQSDMALLNAQIGYLELKGSEL
ncbi:head maturation protease, ClpP-related [Liquorilactobacillus mali]|uniref:ATP-dependent Clp protease proteolytic subunit n=1 Tax=Liquorilactobacillus mali TaxID=1618 RepID=A0A0R2G3Z7_9LACO|nr:head maturation protease, ClpP-related [Liquorilactobacillus mali]KRN31629.1 S14 family endopeptidase ClpP [Liquorilactobacillus mali]